MKVLATRKPMFFGKLLEGPYARPRGNPLPWFLIVAGLALATLTKLL